VSAAPEARTVVRRDHALIAPETHVVGPVPGWTDSAHVTLVAPPMGARFAMSLVSMRPGAVAGPPRPGTGRAVYVLEGGLTLTAEGVERPLRAGMLAYLPPDGIHGLRADTEARVVVIDKPFTGSPGAARGRLVVTDGADVAPEPMLDDPTVRVTTLIPESPDLDLAVNLMTFDPGAALPFTETHVMEHGLLVLEGSLVYRLGDDWHPVRAGDAIWMGPFCPQWCCAYGTGPATYLIYKDWNRDPLA